MLVLDDLHWADKPSLLLLQFLARSCAAAALLVVGTYRDVELRRQHPLAQTLAELNRENLSQRVLLRGLTENDVRALHRVTAGTTPPDALVAGRVPGDRGQPVLRQRDRAAAGAPTAGWRRPTASQSWSVTIPQSVREVVGRRLDHLSEECNEVLTDRRR